MAQRGKHRGGGRQMTKQADLSKTNINRLVDNWVRSGNVVLNTDQPKYGDFSNAEDYSTAMNRVRDAERDFMELPARVRDHVDNDPGKFLEMVFNPERRGELEELGLVDVQAPEAAPEANPSEEPAAPFTVEST